MKRVIFVEPIIENGEIITSIFNKYNPDSSFVNPHICLVFPFESNLDIEQIDNIFQKVFQNYNDFNIQLGGLSISYEEKNNFLFLNVVDVNNILKRISEELYGYLKEHATLKGEYIPHITIGKSKSIQEIEVMYDNASSLLTNKFNANITSIYSKILISDFEGNMSLEKELEVSLSENKIKKL